MTDSNFWADFVLWFGQYFRCADSVNQGARLVRTEREARVCLDEWFDSMKEQYTRLTGRTPPAETRSVDVPPTGGKEALLRLAERIRLAKVAAVERHVSKWSGEDERRAGQVSAFVECEEMVRGLAEEL